MQILDRLRKALPLLEFVCFPVCRGWLLDGFRGPGFVRY